MPKMIFQVVKPIDYLYENAERIKKIVTPDADENCWRAIFLDGSVMLFDGHFGVVMRRES